MRPHRYIVRLNGKERQTLRQLKRAGKTERRLADRARIILWTAEWLGVDEIARNLDIERGTVINWRKWFLARRQQGLSTIECVSDRPRPGRPPKFEAVVIAQIKAVACEQPAKMERPLSRFSLAEIMMWIKEEKIVSDISMSTVWRLLHHDAIRPWYYRAWLFPRDPDFEVIAGPVLDLYQGTWQGEPLGSHDYVLSADEKSAIQVLERMHATLPPIPGQPGRYEFEYKRHSTLAYLAALDVFAGHVIGRVDEQTGIVPFGHLVDQVMRQEPYASAERVFWIIDGGPSHHRNTAPARLRTAYPNIIVVHLPKHASWLNQIEIYFSILQRKALTPLDAPDKSTLTDRILGYQSYFNRTASPFRWNYTRQDMQKRLHAAEHQWSKDF